MNDEYLPGAGAADPSDEAHRGETATRPLALDHGAAGIPAANDVDETRPVAPAVASAAPAFTASRTIVAPDTPGGMIRAAREAQGIDLASLAAMLKIPLRKLEALEEGRHADLPGPTFERALAQAACRVLKLDPKPVLAVLPQLGSNTLEHMGGGINTPFRERAARGEFGEPTVYLRAGVLVPVLIVVAAVVILLLPADLVSRMPKFGFGGDAASAPAASASGGTSTTSVSLPATALPASVPAAGTSPGEGATTAATAPAATSATATPAPASAAAAAGVDEVLAHSETPPSIPVQIMAAQDSWIEVVDSQGHVLLSRTVIAGESVGLDGPLPMKVKIGNARGTRLSLRGENVDLEPWTRDNVARLDLK